MSPPPATTRGAGDEAERAACVFLEEKGMRVVERNFRGRGGEIDIVAREGDALVFVEVRFRSGEGFGPPEETVGLPKRRRIASAAREYLSRVPPASWSEARFDVVAVVGAGPEAEIRHFRGAFDARGRLL